MTIYNEPKHTSIMLQLKSMLAGAPAGTQLLSERDLSERFAVSRHVIRQAIEAMIADEMLVRIPRKGIFVNRDLAVNADNPRLCLVHGRNSILDPFKGEQIHAMERLAAERGLDLLTARFEEEDGIPDTIAEADGLILMKPLGIEVTKPAVVLMLHSLYIPHASYVLVDDYHGGIAAARHLLDLGHQRLAYVFNTFDPMRGSNYWAQERYRGACNAARSAGMPEPMMLNAEGGAISPEQLQPIVDQHCTGVVCATDLTAMAVISCLHRLGVTVPEDISVIGFDDIPAAESFVPRLTTMRLPNTRIIPAVFDELQQYVSNPAAYVPKRLMFPMELVQRDSCLPRR